MIECCRPHFPLPRGLRRVSEAITLSRDLSANLAILKLASFSRAESIRAASTSTFNLGTADSEMKKMMMMMAATGHGSNMSA